MMPAGQTPSQEPGQADHRPEWMEPSSLNRNAQGKNNMKKEMCPENDHHLKLIFSQSMIGVFTMMLEHPIVWNETVDKEAVLNYVFHHQHITRVSQAMLDQYRMTEEEMLKLTPADFFSHNREKGRLIWKTLFDQGRLRAETEERRSDGSVIWIEGEYSCLLDEKGRIVGHMGVQHDVTNRKKAEQWSRYLSSVMDRISDSIIVTDPQQKITLINQATEELYGYRLEELIGRVPTMLSAEPNADALMVEIYSRASAGEIFSRKLLNRRKDGTTFFCELRVVIIQDEYGRPIAYAGIQRDITEQRNLEHQLQESLDRFDQLARQAGMFAWEVDPEGLYTYVSDSVQSVLGYTVEEIVGRLHFYDLLSEPDKASCKQEALTVFGQKKPFVDFKNSLVAKDGQTIRVSTNGLPMLDERSCLKAYRGSDTLLTDEPEQLSQ